MIVDRLIATGDLVLMAAADAAVAFCSVHSGRADS
jgi:hypothetical protein